MAWACLLYPAPGYNSPPHLLNTKLSNHVLEATPGIEVFGTPSWKLTLCLFACWVICCLAVIKGVQSLGKNAYGVC
ncbi:hypothetical protein X801_07890 [Opisthorchis viverrini]|uniref:Uncharacterized protein n=1 Tax=Opisthorchis viverrini TaxID=6198 RepID=A0A1S8WPA7_OPIVI|nr:hypothetical protein X801_07890 [Opisthorchis viverrini]